MGSSLQYLLEHKSGYRLGREEALIRTVAQAEGGDVKIASLSQLRRRRVSFDASNTVVAGGIPFVKAALLAIGRGLPEPEPYPKVLQPWLHRRVEMQPMKAVLARIERTGEAFFLKPADRTKSFTGFVADTSDDFRLQGVSRNQRVWVADPVKFRSEWRAYVLEGEVLYLAWYAGDPAIAVNRESLLDAVNQYVASGAPRGFVIDFGVLADGRTALVEANDGFSVGAYPDVPPAQYTRMVEARWFEMAGTQSVLI